MTVKPIKKTKTVYRAVSTDERRLIIEAVRIAHRIASRRTENKSAAVWDALAGRLEQSKFIMLVIEQPDSP